uniref:cdc42 effector protein 4-like n=1 Tax=Myxine glutinosa TaxID=7769 RepID=UPI00358F006A
MPIHKALMPAPQTKRHSRLDITPGMISAPLGDFRHTLHVGRCGEAFGDTTFLRYNNGSTEPQTETETTSPPETSSSPPCPPARKEGFLSRTLRASKRSFSVNRRSVRASSPSYHESSSVVKLAASLPQLSGALPTLLPARSSDARGCTATYSAALAAARATAKITAPRHHNMTTWTVEANPEPTRATDSFDNSSLSTMCRTDSLLSFHVDLGPSMMDDVLGVMEDVPKAPLAECDEDDPINLDYDPSCRGNSLAVDKSGLLCGRDPGVMAMSGSREAVGLEGSSDSDSNISVDSVLKSPGAKGLKWHQSAQENDEVRV